MAHDVMPLDRAVWVDPDRMSGTPCFRGSRLPVQQLFDWLADGVSLDEFIEDFKIDRQAAEMVLRAAGAAFADRSTEEGARSLRDTGDDERDALASPAGRLFRTRAQGNAPSYEDPP